MLENKFCQQCGNEIDIHVITTEKIFRIDANGELKRDDNNDAYYGDGVHIELLCSNDIEHEVGIYDSEWIQKIDEALEKEGVLT